MDLAASTGKLVSVKVAHRFHDARILYSKNEKRGAPYIQEISQEILFIFSKIVLEQINLATVKI